MFKPIKYIFNEPKKSVRARIAKLFRNNGGTTFGSFKRPILLMNLSY